MNIDAESVDHALMTTRAVRRRLDLERPVDHQIILDCIDVAEQAPSGGNQGSRRWVVVRDQARKDRLAELYLESAGAWMIETRDRLAGTGHPQERTMTSAAHLAEHLAEVPAIVIPTIIGRHDDSGRPGLFDSVIQSVWSFCVALRARGLGTAWTTAILSREHDIADLLGIPDDVTQIAMIPVAWTKGTDFKPAPRRPARDITYVDHYSRTWASGPSDPPCFADGPGTIVEIDIDAPPTAVWPLISDINFGRTFSDEFVGARWADGVDGPAVGNEFVGSNTKENMGDWDIPCFVDRYEPDREFGWVTSDPDDPGAQWRFEIESIAGASRLRYHLRIGPGPSRMTEVIEQMPDLEPRILIGRLKEHRQNMQRVVEGIKAAAEAAAG